MLFGRLGAGICVFKSGMNGNPVIQLWTVLSVHVLVQNLRVWKCYASPLTRIYYENVTEF